MSTTPTAIVVSLLLLSVARPQDPTRYPVDPGPLVSDPVTGIRIPFGYRITALFDTRPTISNPFGTISRTGDLYLTSIDCASSTTHVYRVAMRNGEPVKPLEFIQVTKLPGEFMSVAEDSQGRLFATGNCLHTRDVFRILPDGSAVVHSKQDLGNPEVIAIGTPPASTQERIYAASTDRLFEIDIETGEAKPIDVDLSDVGETKLGGWLLRFDPVRRSVLGARVGASNNKSIEIDLVTRKAKPLGLAGDWPAGVDERGVRYFSDNGRVGFLDHSSATPRVVTFVENLSALLTLMFPAPGGSYYLICPFAHKVYRLDRTLSADRLTLTAKDGGTVNMAIDAGLAQAGQAYFLLAGITGATPGTRVGLAYLPLNVDAYTWVALEVVLGNQGGSIMVGWSGTLDQVGKGSARLAMPPNLPQFRLTMNLCAFFPATLAASNATWLHILAPF